MSDMYFDDNVMKGLNNTEARKFRRSLANELGLSEEQKDAFIKGILSLSPPLTEAQQPSMRLAGIGERLLVSRLSSPQTTSRGSGSGKQPKPLSLSRTDTWLTFKNLSEEDKYFAGIMGPYNFKQISGDGLEEPIEIEASTAFQMQGIPTEKANYKIFGAAFHEGNFIARVQIPKFGYYNKSKDDGCGGKS